MASVARYKFVPSMTHEQDDVFSDILDEDSLLSELQDETSPTKRTAILERLRMSVRRSAGQLHIQERFALFNAIHDILLENDLNTRLACLNLVCEVIPDLGNDLSECMAMILPQLIVFIGHNQVSLKKLAVQTLHVYMKFSKNLEIVLNAIIRLGLESENRDTRMESLIALPILITPNFADEDLFSLTEALVRGIASNTSTHVTAGTDSISLAMISLEKIRNVVGKRNFEKYVQKLSPRHQTAFSNAKTAQTESSRTRKSRSAEVSTNDTVDSKVDKAKLDRGFTIASINAQSVLNQDSNMDFIPSEIARKLKDSDWHLKEAGIEELQTWLEENDKHLEIVLIHLENFFGILKELLSDLNFKVNLCCLQLFVAIVDRIGTKIEPFLEQLVSVFSSKLGDNKIVMKQTNMLVFKKMMQNVSPNKIIGLLKGNIKHRNSRVREETMCIIVASILTFPSNEFDLPQIAIHVAPALTDPKRRVRHAAVETFAVIAQTMGASNSQPINSLIDEIELKVEGKGIREAMQARFARRQLPKLNADGLVEYAVSLPSSGSAKVSANVIPRGADVEWILAGRASSDCPSSARSTPGLIDSPRRHLSAGRSRLPWENGKSNDENQDHPEKLNNTWGFEDDRPAKKNPLPHSSYAVQHNARKTSHPPELSNPLTSYAQLHKSKSAKSQSTKSVQGSNLGPITNGYSLIYKKGSLGNRITCTEHSKGLDSNNNPTKPLMRYHSVGVKSLSPFDSHMPKSPTARQKGGSVLGMKSDSILSTSLPDWSELSSRQRKLLSPVSTSGLNREEELGSLSSGSHAVVFSHESPIQTKPTLVRSASKKGRILKSIDLSDASSNSRLSNATSPTLLSPVHPREPPPGHPGWKGCSPLSSDAEDGPGRHQRTAVGNRTLSAGSRKYDNESLPFDTKPRIARTPVHLRRQSSSDVTITADSPSEIPDINMHLAREKRVISRRTEPAEIISVKKKKSMEIVGHAFDSPEKNINRTMQSTFGSTSGIGSSLEESGEPNIGTAGFRNSLLIDGKEDETVVEDIDGYELEYDTDSEDDTDISDDRRLNDKYIRDYEKHVLSKLGEDDTYSDTLDDDEGDSLEDSEEYEDSDDDGKYHKRSSSSENYTKSQSERQSLSKSTRERMERKRVEEEQRILRDRQRVDELEKLNHLKVESSELNRKKKLAKEKQDIEKLIKRKGKEKERERLNEGKVLQVKKEEVVSQESKCKEDTFETTKEKQRTEHLKKMQLKQDGVSLQEDYKGKHSVEDSGTARQRLRSEALQKIQLKKDEVVFEEDYRSKNEVEELDTSNLKQRADHLKKIQAKKERERRETQLKTNASREFDESMDDLAVQGYHAPSVPMGATNKPAPVVPRTTANEYAPAQQNPAVIKNAPTVPNPAVNSVDRTPVSSPKKKTSNASQSGNALQPQEAAFGESGKQLHVTPTSFNSSLPIWEVTDSELQPFSNGDAAVKTTLKLLSDPDWELKCNGLLHVRRLLHHHAGDVVRQLHVFMLAVVQEVKNLRSQVSRAAIFTLGEMFTRLEKNMDSDLELATNALLKKAGESSSFIRGDVERAMGCMISSVAPTKAIAALVAGGSSHRNVNVRKTAAQFLCMLAERLGPSRCLSGSKDITERILIAASTFASDGGAETRYYGRRILLMLDDHADFERMLQKYLPSKSLSPTLTIVETLRSKGLGDPPSDVSSARARKAPVTSGVGSRSSSIMSADDAGTLSAASSEVSPVSATSRESSRRRLRPHVPHETMSAQDQEEVVHLIELLSSKDWQERMQAIDMLVIMVETRRALFTANVVKIMDGFSPRLIDNNSKVNLHALECLYRVIPTLGETLTICVSSVFPTVAKNLASKNGNIGNMAENVLDGFIKYIDNYRLLQPLCQFILLAPGGAQNRTSAIKKLLTIVREVYPRKPSVVSKHALPVLWKLLESPNSASSASGGKSKDAVHGLASLLYSLMGESLFEQAQAKSHRLCQRLKELLGE